MPGSPQPNLHNTHPPATHGAPLKGAYSIKEHSRRKQNLFQNDSRSILESLKYYEGNECIVSQNILRSILFSLPSTASTHCDCCLSFLPRFFFFFSFCKIPPVLMLLPDLFPFIFLLLLDSVTEHSNHADKPGPFLEESRRKRSYKATEKSYLVGGGEARLMEFLFHFNRSSQGSGCLRCQLVGVKGGTWSCGVHTHHLCAECRELQI